MQDFETIMIKRVKAQPISMAQQALDKAQIEYTDETEELPRVLVPPEVRKRVEATTSLDVSLLARLSPTELPDFVKKQIVAQLTKELLPYVEVRVCSSEANTGNLQYKASLMIEDLRDTEESSND